MDTGNPTPQQIAVNPATLLQVGPLRVPDQVGAARRPNTAKSQSQCREGVPCRCRVVESGSNTVGVMGVMVGFSFFRGGLGNWGHFERVFFGSGKHFLGLYFFSVTSLIEGTWNFRNIGEDDRIWVISLKNMWIDWGKTWDVGDVGCQVATWFRGFRGVIWRVWCFYGRGQDSLFCSTFGRSHRVKEWNEMDSWDIYTEMRTPYNMIW